MKMRGKVCVSVKRADGSEVVLFQSENQIQDDSYGLLARLMGGDDSARINTIYLEYENVATPETEVVVTDFPTSDGAEYYTALSGSRDFLRQRLQITPEVSANSVTYSGMFTDGFGEHGLPFGGSGVNSRVYGMALVSSGIDQTQDKVFARKNWERQEVKSDDLLYVSWTIFFE